MTVGRRWRGLVGECGAQLGRPDVGGGGDRLDVLGIELVGAVLGDADDLARLADASANSDTSEMIL
jgi:hypothetical protein